METYNTDIILYKEASGLWIGVVDTDGTYKNRILSKKLDGKILTKLYISYERYFGTYTINTHKRMNYIIYNKLFCNTSNNFRKMHRISTKRKVGKKYDKKHRRYKTNLCALF